MTVPMSLPDWPVTVARMQTPNSDPAAVSNRRRSLIATFFGLAVAAKSTSVLLARICLTAGSGCGAGSGGRGSGDPMIDEHPKRVTPQHSSTPTCLSMALAALDRHRRRSFEAYLRNGRIHRSKRIGHPAAHRFGWLRGWRATT